MVTWQFGSFTAIYDIIPLLLHLLNRFFVHVSKLELIIDLGWIAAILFWNIPVLLKSSPGNFLLKTQRCLVLQ